MTAGSSPSEAPHFPAALAACLKEDAIVRADARQLQLQQAEVAAAAQQAREATALPGRLLAALGRRQGGPSTPEEAAEIFARQNVLERQLRESERLRQHCMVRLDAQLAAYLQAAVPAFRQQSQARERLAEWARLITDLRADLRELIKMLGQARNNAVAGYDQGAHTISAAARGLFEQSSGLIGRVEARVKQANDQAAAIGGLPRVAIIPLQETVNGLMQHEIVTMLREFDRVVRELEQFEARQLVDLQVPAATAAEAQVAQAQTYLAHYREQLRAHSDGLVTPEEVADAIPLILDRCRRGVNSTHGGLSSS